MPAAHVLDEHALPGVNAGVGVVVVAVVAGTVAAVVIGAGGAGVIAAVTAKSLLEIASSPLVLMTVMDPVGAPFGTVVVI